MEQQTKVGDFVRLTDPIDNGMIVRVETVENGWIEFIGGGQSWYEQVKGSIKLFGVEHFGTLSEFIRLLEQCFGVKLYPESAIKLYRNAAEKNAEELGKSEKYWEDEHNKLIEAQDELAKLKEHIKKVCAESSADIQRLDAENKKLKKELFNVKKQLYCSDQNQKKEHSKFLDALNKYHCELNRRKKAEAKIKELEAELEGSGFNDERNFI